MLDQCTSCCDDKVAQLKLFKSIEIPDDRKYIFRDYEKCERDICIECYIRMVLMLSKA